MKTCIDRSLSWVTGVSDETNIKGFNIRETIADFQLITVDEVYVYRGQATIKADGFNVKAESHHEETPDRPLLVVICGRTIRDLELQIIRVDPVHDF